MVRRSKGLRYNTRKLFRKKPRDRGHLSITKVLKTYDAGTRVAIVIDPAYQRGMPHKRFQGLTGEVTGMQGEAVVVKVPIGKSYKTVVAHPVHLKELKQ